MTWLGLDIGGANLKAASADGWARSAPFPLWRDPDGLAGALRKLVADAPAHDGLAVTMTGELCDCFRTKAEGVRHILAAVEAIAQVERVGVYLVDGRFVTMDEANESPELAAASNWRALAQFACRFVPRGPGLLIDIGSTTTDIIPLADNSVTARGRDDTERLIARELVYGGVGRTPVCAVTQTLPIRGTHCPVAAEIFATTADAYVLLGEIAEERDASWTADGRPLTEENSRQRLARQVCADSADLTDADFLNMAQAIRQAQLNLLLNGIRAAVGTAEPTGTVVLSGGGEFLARAAVAGELSGWRQISLTQELGAEVARAAPAYAVAVLASGS
jgi:probable H4MPT-linked C1 transfer pathway protein